MSAWFRTIAYLLIIATLSGSYLSLIALAQQESDDRSFVLLANGNVLHGVAKPVGDRVELRLGEGSTIQIDKQQVVYVASSKLGLYEKQVKAVRRLGSSEHRYLTEWCIQHELIDQAIYHFDSLSRMTESDAKLKQLEHKLKEAILNSAKVQRLLAGGQSSPPERMPSMKRENPEQLSSHPTTSDGVVLATALSAKKVELSDEQRLLLNSMPGYVKKTFQVNIAPILTSRCGQAGCHGAVGNSDFYIRQAAGDMAPMVAAENLENVLRYIDTKSPPESTLLAYATKAHGLQASPQFNPHFRDDDRRHIDRITQWIKSIELASSQVGNPALSPTVGASGLREGLSSEDVVRALAVRNGEPPVTAIATVGSDRKEMPGRGDRIRDWMDQTPEQDREAKLSKPTKSSSGPVGLSGDEIQQLERAIDQLEKRHSAQSKRDPFDPNVFNSQFGTKPK